MATAKRRAAPKRKPARKSIRNGRREALERIERVLDAAFPFGGPAPVADVKALAEYLDPAGKYRLTTGYNAIADRVWSGTDNASGRGFYLYRSE